MPGLGTWPARRSHHHKLAHHVDVRDVGEVGLAACLCLVPQQVLRVGVAAPPGQELWTPGFEQLLEHCLGLVAVHGEADLGGGGQVQGQVTHQVIRGGLRWVGGRVHQVEGHLSDGE